MEDSKSQEIVVQRLPPVIRRAVILQMTTYEVSEDELEALARGTQDSIYSSFAIFLLSVATSFLVSLLTTEVTDRVFIVFVIFITLGYLFGIFFLIFWYKNRKTITFLIKKIRERLPPPEGIQET